MIERITWDLSLTSDALFPIGSDVSPTFDFDLTLKFSYDTQSHFILFYIYLIMHFQDIRVLLLLFETVPAG